MKKFIVTIVAYVVIGLGLLWECITKGNAFEEMKAQAIKGNDFDLSKKEGVIAFRLAEVLACAYIVICWPYLLIAPIVHWFKEK